MQAELNFLSIFLLLHVVKSWYCVLREPESNCMDQNLIDVRNFVNLNLQVLDFEDLFLFYAFIFTLYKH